MKVSSRLWAVTICALLSASAISAPSLADIKLAAEQGNAEAQEQLGDAFMHRLDTAQSIHWYRKAAEAGRVTAQAKLGNRLFMKSKTAPGLGAASREQLGKEALKWLKPAAQAGSHRAQADLARAYLEGKLLGQDLVEAYKWGDLASRASMIVVEGVQGRTVRDAAVLKMSPTQIAEAKQMVADFKPGKAALPEPPADHPLELKGISGSLTKRIALINDAAFAEGESRRVRVGDRYIVLRCVEIRMDSVVVEIEGGDGRQVLALGERD